jgi:hypothetical protein
MGAFRTKMPIGGDDGGTVQFLGRASQRSDGLAIGGVSVQGVFG